MAPTELIEEMFATFARERTIESVLPFFDPGVEWDDTVVTKTTIRGHGGFVEAMANLDRAGYKTESQPENYEQVDAGTVVASGVTRLVTGESYTDLPAYWAFEVAGGMIVRGATAIRRTDALKAIGRN
jgi:hypothetical protein